jgi:hypothetical protein
MDSGTVINTGIRIQNLRALPVTGNPISLLSVYPGGVEVFFYLHLQMEMNLQ